MELSEMEMLVDLVKRSEIRELTLRNGETRVTLKKERFASTVEVSRDLVPYIGEDHAQAADAHIVVRSYAETAGNEQFELAEVPVTSPLVGIFHHTRPLVGPGARVQSGQVVAVIEAMKLMTEVTSPADGTIIETLIDDGMPAEYGQPLFLVRPE